jgi:hypothetical protein
MVRLAGNYRGKSVETLNQTLGPDFYIWTDRNFTVDASASVSITRSLHIIIKKDYGIVVLFLFTANQINNPNFEHQRHFIVNTMISYVNK